jgi:hypothetical protein
MRSFPAIDGQIEDSRQTGRNPDRDMRIGNEKYPYIEVFAGPFRVGLWVYGSPLQEPGTDGPAADPELCGDVAQAVALLLLRQSIPEDAC